MNDSLQVALVRLRFENIPFRAMSRSDVDCAWPFDEDSIVIYCRVTVAPMDAPLIKGAAVASCAPFYMLSDGVEHTLSNRIEFEKFHTAAMATRGIWMSSGWSG